MPFLALLANPLVRKILLVALVLFAISAAAFAAIKHYEAKGAREARDEQAKQDAEYISGVTTKLGQLQTYYRPYVDALAKAENNRAALRQEIYTKSAANNGMLCVDRAGSARLRSLIGKQSSIREPVR